MATHSRILSWRIPMDRGVCSKESDTTEMTSHTQGYFYGLPWGRRRRWYDRMEKARVWNHETRFCELIARWPQLLWDTRFPSIKWGCVRHFYVTPYTLFPTPYSVTAGENSWAQHPPALRRYKGSHSGQTWVRVSLASLRMVPTGILKQV